MALERFEPANATLRTGRLPCWTTKQFPKHLVRAQPAFPRFWPQERTLPGRLPGTQPRRRGRISVRPNLSTRESCILVASGIESERKLQSRILIGPGPEKRQSPGPSLRQISKMGANLIQRRQATVWEGHHHRTSLLPLGSASYSLIEPVNHHRASFATGPSGLQHLSSRKTRTLHPSRPHHRSRPTAMPFFDAISHSIADLFASLWCDKSLRLRSGRQGRPLRVGHCVANDMSTGSNLHIYARPGGAEGNELDLVGRRPAAARRRLRIDNSYPQARKTSAAGDGDRAPWSGPRRPWASCSSSPSFSSSSPFSLPRSSMPFPWPHTRRLPMASLASARAAHAPPSMSAIRTVRGFVLLRCCRNRADYSQRITQTFPCPPTPASRCPTSSSCTPSRLSSPSSASSSPCSRTSTRPRTRPATCSA